MKSERPETVAELIREGLKFVERDQHVLATDEGFRISRSWAAEEKLRTLVETTRIVKTSN